ncbi:FAD-dependent monooxygenase [Thermaurantiacus sp.]
MMEDSAADILIIGGGLVGQTLALALAAHDISALVVERDDPRTHLASGFDGRASAIASASARMLRALGLADLLDRQGCPIDRIEVAEGLNPEIIRFDADPGGGGGGAAEPLGIMVENRDLRRALLARVEQTPLVRMVAPAAIVQLDRGPSHVTAKLADGRKLAAALAVAADGRRSSTRNEAGIRLAHWSYPAAAIVSMLAHGRPHDGVALELFYPSGPFALLPMRDLADGRHRSALVWTVARPMADALVRLSLRAFAAEVAKRLGGRLGAIEAIAPAVAWPLTFHHAERYSAHRLVLAGDAAHGIHPIAGQGLNLGFRDVAALTQVLADGARTGLDLGDPALARRYERWRRADNSLTAFATDSLARLFALPGKPVEAVRRLGLALVERTPAAKRIFASIARGTAGDLPPLLRGELG